MVVIGPVERNVVDRLHVLDRADHPAVDHFLRHDAEFRKAQRERDHGGTAGRGRRSVEVSQLVLIDGNRFFEEERQVSGQHLDGVGRVVEAVGADQDPVEVGIVQHPIDVVIEGDLLQFLRESQAESGLSRIDHSHDGGIGAKRVDGVEHVPNAATVADDAESLHARPPGLSHW